jgi:hypothetical protein
VTDLRPVVGSDTDVWGAKLLAWLGVSINPDGTLVVQATPNLAAVLAAGNDAAALKITDLATPTAAGDAATKAYVDGLVGGGSTPSLAAVLGVGASAGSTSITNLGAPSAETDAATKQYVDTIAFNVVSASAYTLVLADMGLCVSCTNAAGCTVTIPTNASVAFPVGTQVLLRQFSGTVTVVGASGVTLQSRGGLTNLAGAFAWATAVKTGTNSWDLLGDLA